MPATVAGWAFDALARPWEPYRHPSEVLRAITGLDAQQTAEQICWDCSVVKGSHTAPVSPITFLVLLDVLAWDRGQDALIKFVQQRCTIQRED